MHMSPRPMQQSAVVVHLLSTVEQVAGLLHVPLVQ
jgi:hypothetical protein